MMAVRRLSVWTKLLVGGVSALAFAHEAPAQSLSNQRAVGADEPASRRPVTHVDLSIGIQLPAPTGAGFEEQVKQSENARKIFYDMAVRECAVLKEVFNADCHLKTVRSNNVPTRSRDEDTLSLHGFAAYELTDRPD